jgi:hypothetical protein
VLTGPPKARVPVEKEDIASAGTPIGTIVETSRDTLLTPNSEPHDSATLPIEAF